jgi:cytochrome c oxidase assembly protein subunit 15
MFRQVYSANQCVRTTKANYKQTYADKRLAKNQKFAKMLDVFGYSQLATRIRNDRSILVPEEFNSARTWTEYINRLIGAVSGIFLRLLLHTLLNIGKLIKV